MRALLLIVALSLSGCSYFNDLDMYEKKEAKITNLENIDENFFEKGSQAEIKIISETGKSFMLELNPPKVNGTFEVEYSYVWIYYRTYDDALSQKTSKAACPTITTYKGGIISCTFQGKKVGTNIKSYEKLVQFKY